MGRTPLLLVVCFSINIVSSISIIQVNKHIYINYGISNLALTCLQFAITSVCLFICNKFRMFKTIKIPIFIMAKMALAFCGFVVLTNYSLQFNSIGTYQCLKALTLPFVMMISHFIYKKKYSLTIVTTTVSYYINIKVPYLQEIFSVDILYRNSFIFGA
jgi:solute carrier family 35, member E3